MKSTSLRTNIDSDCFLLFDPSQFLDAQRIGNLTEYLQELHRRGFANEDHTTLLLNCYTKLEEDDKLTNFIMVTLLFCLKPLEHSSMQTEAKLVL